MGFFDFLGQWFWVITVCVVIIFCVAINFFGVIAKLVRDHRIDARYGSSVAIALLIAGTVLLAPISPFIWLWVRHNKSIEMSRQAELRRLADQRRSVENNRRAEKRRQWLDANELTLYYKRIGGCMVVLRPNDYHLAVEDTKKQITNGYWVSSVVLRPSPNSFVFVNKSGDEMVRQHVGSLANPDKKIKGQLSDIFYFGKENKVKLVFLDDIFVPWVNESLLSFKEQVRLIPDCGSTELYYEFVTLQIPPELRELR